MERVIAGGLVVGNTSQLITPHTKMCVLCVAPSGFGKTRLGATMDKMTKRFFDKPTLIVAVEAGEGGGTMSLKGMGVDFVVPQSINDIDKIITWLGSDTTYGGVVLDSATEYVKRFAQPYALSFPPRERVETRKAGVPSRSDYQTMGEKARQHFNALINLTVHPDLKVRKHLLITCLEREKQNEDGVVVAIQPDLPGQMASTATAMFQTVVGIKILQTLTPDPNDPKKMVRGTKRVLVCDGDGVRQVKDRTGLFATGDPPDLEWIYENRWLPEIEKGGGT